MSRQMISEIRHLNAIGYSHDHIAKMFDITVYQVLDALGIARIR